VFANFATEQLVFQQSRGKIAVVDRIAWRSFLAKSIKVRAVYWFERRPPIFFLSRIDD
jgi:hypothetical protein